MEKSLTYKQSIKKTSLHQEAKKKTFTTINKKLISYIFLGLFFVSLLYAFEFIKGSSEGYTNAKKELLALRKENRKIISKLSENAVDNEFYLQYITVNKKYEASIKKYEEIKQTEKIFLFKNMRVFLYEFFPILALFIYFSFNLYRSFKFEPKNFGIKIVHGVFIMYAFFKLFWIFQKLQDFSKPIYYVMTLISAYLVGLAVYLIHKQEINAFNKVREKLLILSYHAMKNTEGEKKEKMLEVIEAVAKN